MGTNLQMHQYCLTCRQSQRKRTHSHKYAQTNRTAAHCVDMSRCQGHEFALNAVGLSACIRKLLSSNYMYVALNLALPTAKLYVCRIEFGSSYRLCVIPTD